MTLDCPRRELFDAVQITSAPTAGRATTLPLLQSLLVEANDNQLKLIGCDGEMWVERTLPISVTESGSLALNARLLNDILGSLPDGDIHLEQPNGNSIRLSMGHSDFRVVGMAPEDFPLTPGISAEAQLAMKAADFVSLIESVDYSVAQETQGRAILTGILLSYDGEILQAVATDTHRLACKRRPMAGLGSAVEAVIPSRALAVVKRLPVTEEGDLTLMFGEGRVIIEADSARVVAQIIVGQYPPYENVIPSSFNKKWLLDRQSLISALRRSLILARDNSQRVVLRSDGDQVLLQARSEGVGEGKEEVQVVKEGDDIEIAFNGKYMLDALAVIETEGVALLMNENNQAAVLKPSDDSDDYTYVIMPMALM